MLAESNRLFNHRAAFGIGDPPGDHTAAFEFEVNVIDLFALSEVERLAAKAETFICWRSISWRKRIDRIFSGGHSGETEPPALIGPGARRIGHTISFSLQDNHHAERRFAFQRDPSGDRGRPGFCLAWLSLNRMKSEMQ